MDPIAGLLSPQDRRRSRNLGLLSAGLSLMADSGWSTEPQDTLSNVARAGLTGLQAYMGSNERALEMQQYRQAQLAQQQEQERLKQQEAAMQGIVANIQGNWRQYFDSAADASVFSARMKTAGSVKEQQELLEELQEKQAPQEIFEGEEGEFWQNKRGEGLVRLNEPPEDVYVPNEKEAYARNALGVPFNAHPDTLDIPTRAAVAQKMLEFNRSGAPGGVTVLGDSQPTMLDNQYAQMFGRITTKAEAATEQLNMLNQVGALLDSGLETGPVEEALLPLRQLGAGVGLVLPENIAPMEAFKAVTSQFALTVRNPESGMGMPGNVSEKDIQFLREAVPSLRATNEGNKIIVDMMRRAAERKLEEFRQAEDWVLRNGNMNGFRTHWMDYQRSNPMFDNSYIEDVRTMLGMRR